MSKLAMFLFWLSGFLAGLAISYSVWLVLL